MIKPFSAFYKIISGVLLIAILAVSLPLASFAQSEEREETALKRVVRTFVNETDELIHITIGDEEIVCTDEHPFYSPVKGWTAACQLRAGDILVTVNSEFVVVEQVQHELLESPIFVYNFEVEDYHTYYVGADSVLVHNICGTTNTRDQRALVELAKEHKNGVTRSEANILTSWASEYEISYHGPMIHPGRNGIWSATEHIKIFKYHIPIIGE